MATRAKAQRADEDALDPVEAADVEHADDPDEGLLELEPDEDEDEDAPDAPDDLDDLDADDVPVAEGSEPDPDSDGNEVAASVVVLPDAAFDDDDEIVIVEADDDDDDEIEGVRDGEFVCRSCYMAKRETQLSDPERLLCRDCA